MADSTLNADDQALIARYNASRGGDVDMDAVNADVARRQANPGPIDTSPAAFARNPGPRDPLTVGVEAAATGKDPQRAMAATLGQKASPQVGGPQQGDGTPQSPQVTPPQPADYLRWDEVVQQREFLHLPVYQQEQARQRYFDTIVAPRVNPDDLPAVKIRFNAMTTGAAGMSLIPNNDDYNIEDRQKQSQALQQRYGLSPQIADKVAYAMYPQKDSRSKIVGQQVAEGAKVFVNKVGEHIGIPFTDYDLKHAANWLTGGQDKETAIEKAAESRGQGGFGTAGAVTGAALGLGAAGNIVSAGKGAVAGYKAAGAADAAAAEAAKFASTPADEILAKDAAANPPKIDPSNPFNASGIGEDRVAKDVGWSGLTPAQQAELKGSAALRKAYSWVAAHPTLSSAAAASQVVPYAIGLPQASLIYHIARSIKGIAKLLPQVIGE